MTRRPLNSMKGLMMLVRHVTILGLLLVGSLAVMAQDTSRSTISFNGYGFTYSDALISHLSVNITRYAGDPLDEQRPGGPQPANTRFDLYTAPLALDPLSAVSTEVTVRFYKTADLNGLEAPLQALLSARPALTSFADTTGRRALPFLESIEGIPVLNVRPHYIETDDFTGISYLIYLTLAVDPITERSYLYTFQGLSRDGSTYVSLLALVRTLAVPTTADYEAFASEPDIAKFNAGYDAYFARAIALAEAAPADQFVPNLDALDAFVKTITVRPQER